MPLMTWLVPASFTAGVQADPGPAIWKLVVFLVVGLGLMVPLGVILTILSLELTDIDAGSSALGFYAAFALTLIGGPIGFLAGFTVPWLTGSPGPARWFANLVGLL
ncbi:conserved hypothetical protein [Streptomyces pristinaespiralis ATCC 25486]|uniref:Uncharacterized protein n=3 Tax=Streptomyces pristinaespiralis TaxID=38300 RepID=B5H6I6_STRE2|nr:conserved hypothetical protein [Streptomyces pristinaespiralis ATCC 25486]